MQGVCGKYNFERCKNLRMACLLDNVYNVEVADSYGKKIIICGNGDTFEDLKIGALLACTQLDIKHRIARRPPGIGSKKPPDIGGIITAAIFNTLFPIS
jgi:hypothetical protein